MPRERPERPRRSPPDCYCEYSNVCGPCNALIDIEIAEMEAEEAHKALLDRVAALEAVVKDLESKISNLENSSPYKDAVVSHRK